MPTAQEDEGDNDDSESSAFDWATAPSGFRPPAKARNTRNKPLTIAQNAAVALLLDALGSDRRLFLFGFAFQQNAKGAAVIRPTAEAMAKRDAEGQSEDDDHNQDEGQVDERHEAASEAREYHDYDAGDDEWNNEDEEWSSEYEECYEGEEENEGDEGRASPVGRGKADALGRSTAARDKAQAELWAQHLRVRARLLGEEWTDEQIGE